MKQHLVVGSWQDLHDRAAQVRFVVFVEEQKVPADLELDELDAECVHALVEVAGKAVATGRLCPDGRIGRMAVLTPFRGRGLGSEILRALISAAQLRGQHETYLHAQMHAIGFYERHGFIAEGPEFDDAGIAHRLMRRTT
jgi:predicted GNAT family N-acyltransferase